MQNYLNFFGHEIHNCTKTWKIHYSHRKLYTINGKLYTEETTKLFPLIKKQMWIDIYGYPFPIMPFFVVASFIGIH